MAFIFTGCCYHEWAEATCTELSACSLCGKEKGELLPHEYGEATCAVCGVTEGERLYFEENNLFKHGLVPVEVGESCGYINESGEIVINPQFDGAENFAADEYALVRISYSQYGIIDETGTYIVNPQYDSIAGY